MKKTITAALLSAIALISAGTTTTATGPFHRPRWADADHDGLDTRAELLLARCRDAQLEGHHVQRATCRDAYTGREVATDVAPQAIQVDHLLPCASAWSRRPWTKAEFEVYYNDPDNLNLTRSRTNAQKDALLPQEWCPALRGSRIASAVRYVRIANRYRIPLSQEERFGLSFWRRGECAPGAKVLGQ